MYDPYARSERATFPDDALTADDRKALGIAKSMPTETRQRHFSTPAYGAPAVLIDPIAAERHVATLTQQQREQQTRRSWLEGFTWGAGLVGIASATAIGALFAVGVL